MPKRKSPATYEPKFLGKPVSGPVEKVELIPWTDGDVTVSLDCAEFTTICPVTGQPDFGRIEIHYAPKAHLVETKSLKLYLQGYRERKGFNEHTVAALAKDLFRQIKPRWMKVTGAFNRRGGICVTCSAQHGDRKFAF
jgi:7-cyano-7-deazaguanine reductase